ncbi:pentapeptide repeat-containing protein [Saccharopolyspora sp. NPDC049357]|uniref:pentapeptide repeat-containing protein n=1 Tax=Saccharopolyspora sp. NPDC049357 TaxID=3154507 RepID=UPI003416DD47
MIVSWWKRQLEKAKQDDSVSVMPRWSIWVGAVALLVAVGASMWVLFWLFGAATDQDKIRLDIVKLAGSVGVGTGGAVALLLAARRQRSAEVSLKQTERDLEVKKQVADDARHNADEQRITELYSSAAEQLGSDKAPVRLSALYVLERIADGNKHHRQTVVNLLCSYLRMPFEVPRSGSFIGGSDSGGEMSSSPGEKGVLLLDLSPSAISALGGVPDSSEAYRQEKQVRQTAQRIIADHIRPYGSDGNPSQAVFWGDLRLDLSGAVLEDLDMSHCRIGRATFGNATFLGLTRFRATEFCGNSDFDRARFKGDVTFDHAQFGSANFIKAKFHKWAEFNECSFGRAFFGRARFKDEVTFRGAHFGSGASFVGARFKDEVQFRDTEFGVLLLGDARFDKTVSLENVRGSVSAASAHLNSGVIFDGSFLGSAAFYGTKFLGPATFKNVQFKAAGEEAVSVLFWSVEFGASVSFEGALFGGSVGFLDTVASFGTDFGCARRRCDSGVAPASGDAFPPGWKVIGPPEGDSGEIEGMDGYWGFVVEDSTEIP